MKYLLVFIGIASVGLLLQSFNEPTNAWDASSIQFDTVPYSTADIVTVSDDEYKAPVVTGLYPLRKYTEAPEYSCRINAQGRMECGPNQASTNGQAKQSSSRNGPFLRLGSRLRGFFSRFRCR